MNKRNFGAAFRKLGVILLMLGLVLFFLFLYYFKYIPDNRERLQHQGFLILRQHEQGILQTKADLEKYFKAVIQPFDEESLKKTCNKDTTIKNSFASFVLSPKIKDTAQFKNQNFSSCSVNIDPDVTDSITFNFINPDYPDRDTIKISVSLQEFFGKILGRKKSELFDDYLILYEHHSEKSTSGEYSENEHPYIFYHSSGLSVAEQNAKDTVRFGHSSIQFSKIIDFETDGNKYKAYLLPYQFELNTFVLAGLMREKTYNERLQAIPLGTISGSVVILLLILLSLPYLKILLISPEEHFSIRDIIFLGITLFIGTALILVMLQNGFMQTGALLREKKELGQLSDSINTNFHNEISKACNELKYLDSSLYKLRHCSSISSHPAADSRDTMVVKGNGNAYHIPLTDNYLNYYSVQWVNASGQQQYIGRLDTTSIHFYNIDFRQYFQNVKNKHLYSLNDSSCIQRFTFEPVYSIISNQFEVNIATPSIVNGPTMIGLSASMYSLMNPILPEGYGFYMVDKEGYIFFQSDGQATLKENFLEWMIDDHAVEEAMRNKESRFISGRYVFDKQYNIFVRPVDDLPFYLVTYHCSGYTTASILRVVSFSLFSLLTLYLVLGFIAFLGWKKAEYRTRLPQSVFQYSWLRPQRTQEDFLRISNCYLPIMISLTAVFVIIRHDASTWFIGLAAPVIALSTVLLLYWHSNGIRSWLENERSQISTTPLILIPSVFFAFFTVIYYQVNPDTQSWYYFLVYEVVSLGLSIAMVVYGNSISTKVYGKISQYISNSKEHTNAISKNYYWFWLWCVMALALLPAHLFFYYAQAREISLIAKGQQLYLAEQTVDRLSKFNWITAFKPTDGTRPARNFTDTQLESICFSQGFYGINRYFTNLVDRSTNASPDDMYDSMIRNISWNHRFDIPAKNRSADGNWKWHHPSPPAAILAYHIPSEISKPYADSLNKYLIIKSTIPGILKFNGMDTGMNKTIIILFSILLLAAFFQLLKFMTNRMFLVQYFNQRLTTGASNDNLIATQISSSSTRIKNKIKDLSDKYSGLKGPFDQYELLKNIWENEYHYEDGLGCILFKDAQYHRRIDKMENIILMNHEHLSGLYKEIWKSCDVKERYFLFDMAKDGFINYKNAQMVQQIIDKGLICEKEPGNIRIMSISFRNYILSQKDDTDIVKLQEEYKGQGAWDKIKTPIHIAIVAVSLFVFITQQDMVTRLLALVPNINSLASLGATIFGARSKSVSPK